MEYVVGPVIALAAWHEVHSITKQRSNAKAIEKDQ